MDGKLLIRRDEVIPSALISRLQYFYLHCFAAAGAFVLSVQISILVLGQTGLWVGCLAR